MPEQRHERNQADKAAFAAAARNAALPLGPMLQGPTRHSRLAGCGSNTTLRKPAVGPASCTTSTLAIRGGSGLPKGVGGLGGRGGCGGAGGEGGGTGGTGGGRGDGGRGGGDGLGGGRGGRGGLGGGGLGGEGGEGEGGGDGDGGGKGEGGGMVASRPLGTRKMFWFCWLKAALPSDMADTRKLGLGHTTVAGSALIDRYFLHDAVCCSQGQGGTGPGLGQG